MKEKILGKSDRFLKLPGIAERRERLICFGIVEGENPCFVYRGRREEDLGPRATSFFYSFIICNGSCLIMKKDGHSVILIRIPMLFSFFIQVNFYYFILVLHI